MADGFADVTIHDSRFNHNTFGIDLLRLNISNDLMMKNVSLIGQNISDSLLNVYGVSSLTIDTVTVYDNTARNGILSEGSDTGSVEIMNFEFIETNYVDTVIDGQQLMQFGGFIHFAMSECVIERNAANYLMNLNVSGDTDISNCNIDQNDIDVSLFQITSSNRGLTLSSINVTNHRNQTMRSLFHVKDIGNVSITDVNIHHNYVSQYIGLEGTSLGDLVMRNTRITHNDNLEDAPSLIDTWIEANHFKNGVITNCEFTDNNNGRSMFVAMFGGDVSIQNVKLTNNNAINDTLFEMDGVSTLTVNGLIIKDNNAPNGISFNGTNSGHAIIEEFEFNNHNYGNIGDTLIEIINFIDLTVSGCNIERMSGKYLFNAAIDGDMSISNCNINNNDIAISLINIVANYGAFVMTQTNISDNKNNISSSVVESMQSLINIDHISSVELYTARITNNCVAKYLTFDGDLSGYLTMDHIVVMDNKNTGSFPRNALINATDYIQATIHNSAFINNDNGTVLFGGVLDGSVSIANCSFMGNDDLITLVDMNGVSSLQMTTTTIANNTAINGILFSGTNSGDVDVNDFVFEYHNDDSSIQSETLILFDLFTN
eukprot:578789_1